MQGRDTVIHALSSLVREHQVLSALVDSLAAYARRLLEPRGAAPRDLAAFTRVLSGFADELHHEKEEEILQPILSRHGFHWQDGVLAEVRSEHERERYLTEVLSQAAECELAWTAEDRRSIAATALALVTFQREHMDKENHELFPEVLRRLSSSALEQVRAGLERFDRAPRHVALGVELLRVADDLIARYPSAPRLGSGAAVALGATRGVR